MDTMNALVWKGDGALSLERRPVPTLQGPRDAIVRVTRSTICTSDLHIRNGAVPRARPGVVLGHEFVGVVEAVGNGISNLRPGDRVAACCESFCGDCWFCRRGYVNNCVHGGWELGCRIDGCQAEYVRVPFADTGLTPIPDALSDEDALFVGDILASGYWGAELCAFQPGDTAVVLGLGPVGPQAARLAYRFQQRQCRGRGRGRRFHGQGQKHADRRGYVAHRRRFGPGASRHPADPFRPERSAAQILRRSRRRTGCGDRRPRVVRQAGRHTGQHGADRHQRPLQGLWMIRIWLLVISI